MDTYDYAHHFYHRLATTAHALGCLLQVELHPGPHCDLYQCPHCYGHGQRILPGQPLSPGEFGVALDDVLPFCPTVIVSGVTTEPLTHAEPAAVIAEVRRRGLPLGLYTKGRRLEGDVVDALLHGSGECFVTVSLDEIDPGAYLTRHGLRLASVEKGPGGLSAADYQQRVLDNVRAFKARRDALGARVELRIALLLFAENSNESAVVEVVRSLADMADRLRIAFPQNRNDGRPPGDMPDDTARVLNRLQRRFEGNPKVRILVDTAKPVRDTCFSLCRAQRFQITIDRCGNVFPCPQVAVQPYRHLSFGNIREQPLRSLLRSPRRFAMFEWEVDRQMGCRICDRKDEAVNVALAGLSMAFDRSA
jgi:radical SAM protein with 4Fe4S-binding SPASM domain